MIVLGFSGLYHDSAAALLEDGHIVAAAQEERFTRIKNDAGVSGKCHQVLPELPQCGIEGCGCGGIL